MGLDLYCNKFANTISSFMCVCSIWYLNPFVYKSELCYCRIPSGGRLSLWQVKFDTIGSIYGHVIFFLVLNYVFVSYFLFVILLCRQYQ